MMKSVGAGIVLGLVFPYFLLSGQAFAQGGAKAGAKFYKKLKCGKCHGGDGAGQGPAAKALKLKITNWTDKAAMSKLSDDYLKNIIGKGGKAVKKSKRMPAYSKKLTPADVEDLVAYIRSFAK